MYTQKRHSETLPNRYVQKKLLKLVANQEDIVSHDSDSTCEDGKEKEKSFIMEMEPRSKLKVELCRNFIENKLCPYRQRCKFAHGLEQLLRNEDLGHNFRTKKCKVFYDKKYCRFGERCNFKHTGSAAQEFHNLISPSILNSYPQMFVGFHPTSKVLKWTTNTSQ